MDDSPPIRTSLQLNLLGTVILSNPARSLATLEDKSANMVYPLRANDELPGKLKVLKVEARRMIFFNLANYRKEFVEMPEETGASTKISRVTLTTPSASAAPPSDDKIKQVSETQFTVEGSALDQALANLPLVLTQAKAVPNFENGVPAGFRLTQIVPGSIYTQLGIKDDDILYGFDGERINDAGRAMDALNNLKTAKTLSVQLKRKDHRLNLDYTINR